MHCTYILFEVDSVSETMKNDSHKLKFITALLLRSDGKCHYILKSTYCFFNNVKLCGVANYTAVNIITNFKGVNDIRRLHDTKNK